MDASKFHPWAFRIARDCIYREYRRRKWPGQSVDEAQLAEAAGRERQWQGDDDRMARSPQVPASR